MKHAITCIYFTLCMPGHFTVIIFQKNKAMKAPPPPKMFSTCFELREDILMSLENSHRILKDKEKENVEEKINDHHSEKLKEYAKKIGTSLASLYCILPQLSVPLVLPLQIL